MDAMNRTNDVTIQPVAPTCGAEVVGIDLLDPSPETMALVTEALADHTGCCSSATNI